MHLIHIAWTLACSISWTLSLPHNAVESPYANAFKAKGLQRRARTREVIFVNDPFAYQFGMDPDTGDTTRPSHSLLFLGPSDTEKPMYIDLNYDEGTQDYVLKVVNFKDTDRTAPTPKRGRAMSTISLTTDTNADFFDEQTGKGHVFEAVKKFGTYQKGPTFPTQNTCHEFIVRVLEQIEDTPNDEMTQRIKSANSYYKNTFRDTVSGKVTHVRYEVASQDRAVDNQRTIFQIDGDDIKTIPIEEYAAKHHLNRAIKEPGIPSDDPFNVVDTQADVAKDPPSNDALAPKKGDVPRLSLARIGGELKAVTTVAKGVANTLGIAGAVAGLAFVILDFVNKNWEGAGIGLAGAAVGLGLGLAISGPLGWVVGGIVTALFAILPMSFKKPKSAPSMDDVQKIIQFKFFGDSDHTGNEQCQKGTDDTPGNKDCQAVYGAGILNLALGFNNFDSFVFLIQNNKGFPMTIPEIAKAFHVVDKEGDGDDKLYTIKCNNLPQTAPNPMAPGAFHGDDPKLCNHPTFYMKRDKITIPGIDKPASEVIKRIIPADGGDCKLVSHAGDQYYPAFKMTTNGEPVAIAWGLHGAINVQGIAVPVGDDTNGTPQTVSNGQNSTDGNPAFVAPPEKSNFTPLSKDKYLCLQVKDNDPFCLPPGDYKYQGGMGFDMVSARTLTLPKDWKLKTDYYTQAGAKVPSHRVQETFDQNQDHVKDISLFAINMIGLKANVDGKASFTVVAPDDGPDPVCCLFTETNYAGNVWCAGVGGSDLPDQWKDKAQSISCHGGGWIYIFAKEYGDAGEALITKEQSDLKDQVYGEDNFSKKIKAVWITKGS